MTLWKNASVITMYEIGRDFNFERNWGGKLGFSGLLSNAGQILQQRCGGLEIPVCINLGENSWNSQELSDACWTIRHLDNKILFTILTWRWSISGDFYDLVFALLLGAAWKLSR